jgi:hypothetical protein
MGYVLWVCAYKETTTPPPSTTIYRAAVAPRSLLVLLHSDLVGVALLR